MLPGEIFEVCVKSDLDAEAQRKGYDEIPECCELFECEVHPGNQADHPEIDDEQKHKCSRSKLERPDDSCCHCDQRPLLKSHAAFWTRTGCGLAYFRVHRAG